MLGVRYAAPMGLATYLGLNPQVRKRTHRGARVDLLEVRAKLLESLNGELCPSPRPERSKAAVSKGALHGFLGCAVSERLRGAAVPLGAPERVEQHLGVGIDDGW